MAISWSGWDYSGNNGMRIGIDYSWGGLSGGNKRTITWKIYTHNQYRYNDNQKIDLDYDFSGSQTISYSNTQNAGVTKLRGTRTYTYTYPSNSYGSSPGSVRLNAQVIQSYNGSKPSKTRSVSIPARPYADPVAPSDVTSVRVSDTEALLSWTRNVSNQAPYNTIEIQRRDLSEDGWSDFTLLTTVSGTATSYSDTTALPNRGYEYQIRATNGAGSTDYVQAAATVYMTPGAPVDLEAGVSGTGNTIDLTWTNTTYDDAGNSVLIERQVNGGGYSTVATLNPVVDTWTDPSPGAGTNQYRVSVIRTSPDSLASDTVESGSITTIVAPLAPTLLDPDNGESRDLTEDQTFTWKHNHGGDGAGQTHYTVQVSDDGGSTWTAYDATNVASTVSSVVIPGGTLSNGSSYLWRVQTQGNTSESFGPFSDNASFSGEATPVISLVNPSSTVTTLPITVEWSYTQADGHDQASWSLEVYRGTVDPENLLVSYGEEDDDTSVELGAEFIDGQEYTLVLSTVSVDGIQSNVIEHTFVIDLLPPALGTVEGEYDECSGTVVLDVSTGESIIHRWTGTPNESTSEKVVDGQVVATNLALNPSFEDAGSSVEVYRNYRIYPGDAPSGTTGWSQSNMTLTNPGGYVRGESNVSAGVRRIVTSAGTRTTVVAGEKVTVSAEVRGTATRTVTAQMWFFDSGGVLIGGNIVGATVALHATDWAVASVDSIAPVGADSVAMGIYTTDALTGEIVDMRRATIQRGNAVSPFPFSGHSDTSPDPDLTPEWTGTANASESRLMGTPVANTVSSPYAIQSAQWVKSGAKSVRLIPLNSTGSGTDSYTSLNGGSGIVTGLEAGKTYTVSATARMVAPQIGTLSPRARKIVAFTQVSPAPFVETASAAFPNAAGEYNVSLTFSVPVGATSAFVRLYNGAAPGGGDVWWDDVIITEGTEVVPYFDGNTPSYDDVDHLDLQRQLPNGDWLTIASALPPGAPYPEQYEENFPYPPPDPEEPTYGWGTNDDDGTKDLAGPLTSDPSVSVEGGYSLKESWNVPNTAGLAQWVGYEFTDLIPGQEYTIVSSLYLSANSGSIRPEVLGDPGSYGPVVTGAPNTWIENAFTFTPNGNTVNVGYSNLDPDEGQTLNIDKVVLYIGAVNGYDETLPDPLVVTDTIPNTTGENRYRVITYAFSGTSNIGPETVVEGTNHETDSCGWAFLSYGRGFRNIVKMGGNLDFSGTSRRQREATHYLGRSFPLLGVGGELDLIVQVSGLLWWAAEDCTEDLCEYDSSADDWEDASFNAGIVCYRDYTGRRIFGTLSEVVIGKGPRKNTATISFTVTETQYTERSGLLMGGK